MRVTRIYVDAPLQSGAQFVLPPGPAAHVAKVLRLQAGAELCLFNGHGGEFDARIESVQRANVTLQVGAHRAVERESPLQVTLLQGIARGEKMDMILQKSTELGVADIVPVLTARSAVRLDEPTAARKQAHWQGVVISACEQSGRTGVPQVSMPTRLEVAVTAAQAALKLLLEPGDAVTLKSLLNAGTSAVPARRTICLLVGPEGGFDPAESAAAIHAGFQPCTLGPRVLRTETAALAALAALQSLAGDLS